MKMRVRLNTVKSKVLAGVAAVTLLSGAGFVAANTDAGTQLQNWYNKAFGTAVVEVSGDAVKHGATEQFEFVQHAGAETVDAATKIKATKEEEKNAKTVSIHAAKQSHIDSVNAKESEIAGYMEEQFNQLSKKNIDAFNFTSDKAYTGAELGLKLTANLTGDAAFRALQKELNAEKQKAVSELEKRIADAKGELLKQLENEKNATKEEIRAAIDAKIKQMTADITAKKNELVASHQEKLINKANEIELAAKAELDALVASINKK